MSAKVGSPMVLSFNNLLVFAPDLSVAREFYGETLGLELVRSEENFLAFKGVGFELDVFSCSTATQASGYSERPGSSIAFSVPELEVAVSALMARGVRFLHDTPQSGPLGRYVAFSDPFGTVHELVEADRCR